MHFNTIAQNKAKTRQPVVPDHQVVTFKKLAEDAGISFTMPDNFKSIKVINSENLSFDYAMTMPGHTFEILFNVQSVKPDWDNYEHNKNTPGRIVPNPDSSYLDASQAQAATLSAESKYFVRNVSPHILTQFNADAGKTYLVNLQDLPETHHYKYALIFALEKNRIGYFTAVCLTNDKGPEFYRTINQARSCIKFN
ncbi:hypothetical protein HH214_01005 [Mucilaginibacter robiniae]|uniref:PsbP C-terminal domain-containing protein n=1 Tax=Mucilaginibacter robiniae TaxID=2728022 RepID=A0A7L5DTX6_9SPHI|nr:hypothetical protein [Mucilaginibacter robiniae]QJD94550.1 hypothetical protein HH214_01005 [Mucilaginibacter robiniae]